MERPRRSLIVTTSYPPVRGGIESYVHLLSDVLGRAAPVTVLTRHTDGDAAFDAESPHTVHRFDRSAGAGLTHTASLRRLRAWAASLPGDGRVPWRTWASLAANRSIARDAAAHVAGRFDVPPGSVVHAARAFPEGVLSRLLVERMRLPAVVYAHGAELFTGTETRRRAALTIGCLRAATRVAAVSAFTERRVVELGVPPERIVRLPPAIDAAPFLREVDVEPLRRRLGIRPGPVLLTHGRLDPRKGHDVVLAALPALLAKEPTLTYVITGTGPTEPELRRLVTERGLEGAVVFGGRVAPEHVPALYRLADVFLMVSRQIGSNVEGFGIVCLEAAAAGRPVVAGRSGGTADAVEDGVTGLLVSPTDVGAVTSAVLGLLGDETRRRDMGERGRRRVLAEFDRDAFARRVESLMEAVSREACGAR